MERNMIQLFLMEKNYHVVDGEVIFDGEMRIFDGEKYDTVILDGEKLP